GKTALVTTVQSLLYGTVEAQITQSYVPGAVTGLTLAKATFDKSDEIDFEWLGSERNSVWTKFFYRGLRDPQGAPYYDSRSMNLSVAADNSRNFHTYKIEWTPYAITWSIDGTVRRVQNRSSTWEPKGTGDMLDPPASHYHYPEQPLLIRFGIYDPTGAPWSGGPIKW
ncbi:concanavalin A-like lectin/glucanase domain-containing protein, partial [Zopfochytrium polystomum]